MSLISRALATSLLLVLLPTQPASAAPTTATVEPHLTPVTLAPESPATYSALWVRTKNAEPGTPIRLEVTVDLGGATAFAGIEPAPDFEATPCRRTGETLSCAWTMTPSSTETLHTAGLLAVEPLPTAKIGDRAEITMAARVADGAVTNGTSVIQVGEGVDLVSDGDRTVKAAPGRAVRTTPTVRNGGRTAIAGAVLALVGHPRLLGPSSYRNCHYDIGMVCTFDTTLEPGRRYALSAPVTLDSPADTVPGSLAPVAVVWMTPTEWAETESDDPGRTGTGAPLTLKPLAAAQTVDPQADVRPENNSATITFAVTGTRKPSLAAVGSRVSAAVGDQRTLTAGVMNFGPGTLRPDLFWNNSLDVSVRLPGNVAAEDGADCYAVADEWSCRLTQDLGPGRRATFPFRVLVEDDCGAPGQVEIRPDDDGQARKIGPLSVNVAGATCAAVALPITGSGPATTALAGLALITAGLVLVVRRSRRPFRAHAEGARWPRPRQEGRPR